VLDAGCGSGILAIAAGLLGYDKVDAFDFDPDAVRVAKENLEINNVSNIVPTVGDAAEYAGDPEKYDLVCANILGHLLIAFSGNISTWVKDGRYLSLAGILNQDFDAVSRCYCEKGFEEIERFTLKEWTSGLFRKVR
jgi:ribosomal protein L11 methyltransferase